MNIPDPLKQKYANNGVYEYINYYYKEECHILHTELTYIYMRLGVHMNNVCAGGY